MLVVESKRFTVAMHIFLASANLLFLESRFEARSVDVRTTVLVKKIDASKKCSSSKAVFLANHSLNRKNH